MATIKMDGIDQMIKQLETLGADIQEITKQAVAAAGPTLQASMRGSIQSAANRGYATGALANSVTVRDPRVNSKGAYVTVGPKGRDSRGTRMQEVAGYLEYGTARQTAHPFMQQSVKSAESAAQAEIEQVFESALSKYK